jgi:hypothetical protein
MDGRHPCDKRRLPRRSLEPENNHVVMAYFPNGMIVSVIVTLLPFGLTLFPFGRTEQCRIEMDP